MATRLTVSQAEQIELEYKQLQMEELREKINERRDRKERAEANRIKQVNDFAKAQRERERIQTVCKHRKGGRDNKFARGNDANYSVILNTYPTGVQVFMCTRCGKEVPKPHRMLKKSNPKLYDEMWAEWVKWNEYPTDNTPSGGKIFEIFNSAAA